MRKSEHRTPGIQPNADEAPYTAGGLSEEGSARRRFLEGLGKWSAALAVGGLGAETALQVLSERSVLASAVAAGSGPHEIPPPPVPTGAIYWVAPDGADGNSGTESSPFATVQKAHAACNPGDGIYVKAGTYSVRRFKWGKPNVILRGAPGTTRDRVILDAGGGGWGSALQFTSNRVNGGDQALENIQLYGITVQGGSADGGWIDEGIVIRGYVRNFKAINCIVRHFHNRGVLHSTDSSWDAADFPHNIEWAYCDFYSIGKDTAGGDISLGSRTGYVHIHHNEIHGDVDGVVMEGAYIGSLIEYNNIYDHFGPDGDPSTGSSSEDGVDLKLLRHDNPLLPSGHRTVIRHNSIHGHPKQSGITVQMAAKRTTIFGNDIYNNRTGIWSRPSERDGGRCCTEDIIIEDNDIHDNYYRGITIAWEGNATEQVRGVEVLNNRIYDNGNEGGPNPTSSTRHAGISAPSGSTLKILGNIFSNNGTLATGNPQCDFSSMDLVVESDNNLFYMPDSSFNIRVRDDFYSLPEWQSASGWDKNSTLIRGTYTPPVTPRSPTFIEVVDAGSCRNPV